MLLKDVISNFGAATVVLMDTDELEDLTSPEQADTIARGFSDGSKYLGNEVEYIYPAMREGGPSDWRTYPLSPVIVIEIKKEDK